MRGASNLGRDAGQKGKHSLLKKKKAHKNPQKLLLLAEVLRLVWPEIFT